MKKKYDERENYKTLDEELQNLMLKKPKLKGNNLRKKN